MRLILPRPVYTPRSGRSTRSGPVRQDISFKQVFAYRAAACSAEIAAPITWVSGEACTISSE
jgi:hypothetical protein